MITNETMNNIIGNIYQKVGTRNFYKVIAVGRTVYNPTETCVIYEQMYNSKLRDVIPEVVLPEGTIWIRKLTEWTDDKFKQIQLDNYLKIPKT